MSKRKASVWWGTSTLTSQRPGRLKSLSVHLGQSEDAASLPCLCGRSAHLVLQSERVIRTVSSPEGGGGPLYRRLEERPRWSRGSGEELQSSLAGPATCFQIPGITCASSGRRRRRRVSATLRWAKTPRNSARMLFFSEHSSVLSPRQSTQSVPQRGCSALIPP